MRPRCNEPLPLATTHEDGTMRRCAQPVYGQSCYYHEKLHHPPYRRPGRGTTPTHTVYEKDPFMVTSEKDRKRGSYMV